VAAERWLCNVSERSGNDCLESTEGEYCRGKGSRTVNGIVELAQEEGKPFGATDCIGCSSPFKMFSSFEDAVTVEGSYVEGGRRLRFGRVLCQKKGVVAERGQELKTRF